MYKIIKYYSNISDIIHIFVYIYMLNNFFYNIVTSEYKW